MQNSRSLLDLCVTPSEGAHRSPTSTPPGGSPPRWRDSPVAPLPGRVIPWQATTSSLVTPLHIFGSIILSLIHAPPYSVASVPCCASAPWDQEMEVGSQHGDAVARLALVSRSWHVSWEKQVRAGRLRFGGIADEAVVALRAHGAKPVDPPWSGKASQGELFTSFSPSSRGDTIFQKKIKLTMKVMES